MTHSQVVVRSRRQPYIVFAVLLTPMIALTVYATFYSGDQKGWVFVGGTCFILAAIYYYLWSLRLALENNHVTYRATWRYREIALHVVESIEPGQWMYGSRPWVIRPKGSTSVIVVNVANFEPTMLRKFAEAVRTTEPGIRVSVFSS